MKKGILLIFLSFSFTSLVSYCQIKNNLVRFSLTVRMFDSSIWKVNNAIFLKYQPSSYFYEPYEDYEIDYLPLYIGDCILLKTKFCDIKTVKIDMDENERKIFEYGYCKAIVVKKNDSIEQKGLLWDIDKLHCHRVKYIVGHTVVDGYNATKKIEIKDISSIKPLNDPNHKILFEITKTDGEIITLWECKFKVDAEDSRSSSDETEILKLQSSDATIDIPLSDIKSIKFVKDKDGSGYIASNIVELHNGKIMNGELDSPVSVVGKTIYQGNIVSFVSEMTRISCEIESILFE